MHRTPRAQLQLHSVSIELGGQRFEGGYVFAHGLVSVSWYNSVDFRRHQLGTVSSSDPDADAAAMLRAIVLSAKHRGEL